jgi:hypothetical protein
MNEIESLPQFRLFPAVVHDQLILWTVTGTDSPSVMISFLRLKINIHYGQSYRRRDMTKLIVAFDGCFEDATKRRQR